MKIKVGLWVVLMALTLLQGCDSNDGLLDDDHDTRALNPRPPKAIDASTPRPPQNVDVITTTDNDILDVSGGSVMLRGVNIQYADSPDEQLKSIAASKSVGANVVRIRLDKNTTAAQLRSALDEVMAQGMIAMPVFWGAEGEIECTRSSPYIMQAVENYWLDAWMPVLSEAKYQPYLMINIASKWGPTNIFSETASKSYADYIDYYKYFIQQFRAIGFKVPLVIDAPSCGQDHFAFMGGRGRELLESDELHNIVLSVHAFGPHWNSLREIQSNTSDLQRLPLPFFIGEFGGSDVNGSDSVDHLAVMEHAAGDYAASLQLPWEQAEDVVSLIYPLPESVSALNQIFRMDVFLPTAYVVDGNLSLQMYLRDASGNVAFYQKSYASAKTLNRWNRLSAIAFSLDDFSEIQGDFTGENITHIGLAIDANGKSADVSGEIKIDNVVFGGPVDPIYRATFDTDSEGWDRLYGAPVTVGRGVYQEDGVLKALPQWGAVEDGGSVPSNSVALTFEQANTLEPAIDLNSGLIITFDVFIPEEYESETGLVLQPFINDDTANNVFASLDYIDVASGRFKFGEWSSISVQIVDFSTIVAGGNFDIDAGPKRIGLQILNVTAAKTTPIEIDNIVFDRLDSLSIGAVTVYEAHFDAGTDGWQRGAGAGNDSSVTQQNGALATLPTWGLAENRITLQRYLSLDEASKIDLSIPFTVSFKLFIPSEYSTETDLAFQPFMNGSDGPTVMAGWSGFAGLRYIGSWLYTVGAWNTFEISFDGFDAIPDGQVFGDFYPEYPLKGLGMEILNVNALKSQPILMDDFTIENIIAVTDSVLSLDFSSDEQLDALAIDESAGFVRLDWEAVKAPGVISRQFGVKPFGWMAWSWYGDSSGWDLSVYSGFIEEGNAESGVSLTARGEEVVNGTYGIFKTSTPVSF